MRTRHQCFVHCFGGLLGLHFNMLDLFALLSIHLAGFLHVGLIYFFLFPVSSEGVSECQLPMGGHGPHRGQTWLCGQEALAAGPGIFGCASCRLNHEQRSRCAWDDNAARPRLPLCNQLSAPSEPLLSSRHLREKVRVYLAQQKAGLELLKHEV